MSVVFGATTGDGLQACALFLQRGDQAEYHLGASTNAGRGLQTLLLYAGFLRLRQMGVKRLNLGGGVRRGDGLFQFKASFEEGALSSRSPTDLSTGRLPSPDG